MNKQSQETQAVELFELNRRIALRLPKFVPTGWKLEPFNHSIEAQSALFKFHKPAFLESGMTAREYLAQFESNDDL
jgi:hypothetical protein